MAIRITNPRVDFYFNKSTKWQQELEYLRMLVLDCGLTEKLKWGVPCYTFEDKNIVLIHVFKDYCALLFFKGVLLQDAEGILFQQTKNVQSARQARFTQVEEIRKLKSKLKAYIFEAIEVEKAGLKVKLKKTTEYSLPAEVISKLETKSAWKKAFYALTPGRQRGYMLYFSAAKQSKTREARLEKSMPRILKGRGIND